MVASRRSASVSYNSTPTANVGNVRDALAREGMHFDNDAAIDRYPAFKEVAFDVVLRERNSVMSPGSAKRILIYQKVKATANEKEYYSGLHPMIVKPSRLIPGHKPKPQQAGEGQDIEPREDIDTKFNEERDGTLKGDVQPGYEAFEKSGLGRTQDQEYVEGLLPVLEKDFGLSTPAPDFVFGFMVDQYPSLEAPRISYDAIQLIRVTPKIEHPFFVIEGKGSDRPIGEAENQAIRAGAPLVNARRLLQQKAYGDSQVTAQGPDVESFVFSCAWVPHYAVIFVNWAEVNHAGKPYYHMNLIENYTMNRKEELQAFRRAIHNILDWGLQPARKQALDDLIIAIAAIEENERTRQKAEEEAEKANKKAARKAARTDKR